MRHGWTAWARRLGVGMWMALGAMLLSGCASVEYRSPKLQAQTDGAVVIRVLPNVQSSSLYFKNWQALEIARLPGLDDSHSDGKEKVYSIAPTTVGASRSALYAGSLPPGHYRFVKFSAMQCGAMCVQSWMGVNQKFSRFEVKAGQITDLGVLVQTAGEDSRSSLLTHAPKGGDALTPELVRELLPDIAPLLRQPTLGWREATVPPSMGSMQRLSITRSWGFASPHEDEAGSFLYGSANGVVGRWSPPWKRQSFDVGERVAIDAVLVTPAGDWIAGGEYSVVKLSKDRGATWNNLRGQLPLGLVVDLTVWRDEVLLTMLKGGKDVQVYRAPAGTDQWKLASSHPMDINWFFDVQGATPHSALVSDTLVTTVPGRQLAVLDLPTGRDDLRKLPGAAQMFSASADGVLRCRCISTIKVDPYESRDLGQTWQESTASRFMLMPTFKDKSIGVAFKGGFFSPSKFTYTRDGGNTWTETTEAPVFFNQLFFSRDGRKAYAVSLQGIMWVTDDDGESWDRVQ
ncbi:hypothetical protein SAMN05216359_101503 [Roseateles sp. YR242]|uniref:WD40/YVTN/BNR-like repeat-containing protein n=1 Tax=Roseateles sp. YR242 TaxID=1855305 RepID=UPI0008D672CE|nr:hypothetical protein [Roseateles sp. YR242]SEK34546.1 hypothetical protein SAMN05216359_101503 [Roseateles sp. YR242]